MLCWKWRHQEHHGYWNYMSHITLLIILSWKCNTRSSEQAPLIYRITPEDREHIWKELEARIQDLCLTPTTCLSTGPDAKELAEPCGVLIAHSHMTLIHQDWSEMSAEASVSCLSWFLFLERGGRLHSFMDSWGTHLIFVKGDKIFFYAVN
jgi:hypothetical protein